MFATVDDVRNRFEGVIPDDRTSWVETRLDDVEEALLDLVPSLAEQDVSAGRLRRAKTLVCDKVLELYRNPGGATYTSTTMGPMTEAKSTSKDNARGRIAFSSEELRTVRKSPRRRFGVIPVAPWGVPR